MSDTACSHQLAAALPCYVCQHLGQLPLPAHEVYTATTTYIIQNQGSEKRFFLKRSPTYWVLGGFTGFWALFFSIFYLNKQLGSLLVDLAHQLSFYLDSPVF